MPAPEWAPSNDQVKALIPQRTGGLAFSDDTIPTATDVGSIIEQVCAEVQADACAISDDAEDPTNAHADLARWCATLGAAAYIEQSFFPDQQQLGGDLSPGQLLYRRYTDALARLRKVCAAINQGDVTHYTTKTPSAVVADAPFYPVTELLP